MKMTRREALRLIALAAGSAALPRAFMPGGAFAQTTDPAGAAVAASKAAYFGRFWELPVGTVKPRGWIKGWLTRQLAGLTGHPENLAYPYDICMYGGIIPPPPLAHGQIWWPYEQSGYFVDGAVRLSHLIDDASAQAIPRANLDYILNNSGPGKLGGSTWGWPNTVVGRALLAEYSATGNLKVANVLETCLLGSRSMAGRDGYVFEEALYLYGKTGDSRLLDIAKQAPLFRRRSALILAHRQNSRRQAAARARRDRRRAIETAAAAVHSHRRCRGAGVGANCLPQGHCRQSDARRRHGQFGKPGDDRL
jgi:hypothetical protein